MVQILYLSYVIFTGQMALKGLLEDIFLRQILLK